MKNVESVKEVNQERQMPTAEEIAMAQNEAEAQAQFNAAVVGRLTIKTATELADLKATYYKTMYEALQKAGFTKEEAMSITQNLKV